MPENNVDTNQLSTTTEVFEVRGVLSPCPFPFRIQWNAREMSWVKKGQIIATCQHQGQYVRLSSPYTGRLAFRRYDSNSYITTSNVVNGKEAQAETDNIIVIKR